MNNWFEFANLFIFDCILIIISLKFGKEILGGQLVLKKVLYYYIYLVRRTRSRIWTATINPKMRKKRQNESWALIRFQGLLKSGHLLLKYSPKTRLPVSVAGRLWLFGKLPISSGSVWIRIHPTFRSSILWPRNRILYRSFKTAWIGSQKGSRGWYLHPWVYIMPASKTWAGIKVQSSRRKMQWI